jgi:serine/threonine-protein kinase
LTALQLVVTSRSEVSDSVPAGKVISAAPGSGATVARGSTVALVVSKGPALVTVPSLRSVTSLNGAIAVLRNAGLRAGNVSGPAAGRPKYTSPPAGRRIARDSTVDIVLG